MDIGKHIIEAILREREPALQQFLKAEFDAAWLTDPMDLSRAGVFSENDRDVYSFILRRYEATGKVPTLGYFRDSYPEETYRLPAPGPTTDELLEMASRNRLRNQLIDRNQTFYEHMEAEDYDAALETMQSAAQLRAADSVFEFPPAKFLRDLDDTPVVYWIDGAWKVGGNKLNSGYAKTGKTTQMLHSYRALLAGDSFLDRECGKLDGRIVLVNFEMDERDLREYAVDAGLDIANEERLTVLNYRGEAGKFRFDNAGWRRGFAHHLEDLECDILGLDPLSVMMAMVGLNSDNPDEARRALEWVTEIGKLGGFRSVDVNDHTGHSEKGRARGASSKLDWADALWNLQVDGDEESPARILRVTGRHPGTVIHYYRDEATGELLTGKFDDGPSLVMLLKKNTGQTAQELADQMGEPDKRPNKSTVTRQLVALETKKQARRESPKKRTDPDQWYGV
jgi:hypothetical protein